MKVTLSTGVEIELICPVVMATAIGKEFIAKINGEVVTIPLEGLENAKFPDDVTEQVEKACDDTLPDIRKGWNRLKKFYDDHGEKV